jgi:hypothetical protein
MRDLTQVGGDWPHGLRDRLCQSLTDPSLKRQAARPHLVDAGFVTPYLVMGD